MYEDKDLARMIGEIYATNSLILPRLDRMEETIRRNNESIEVRVTLLEAKSSFRQGLIAAGSGFFGIIIGLLTHMIGR